MQLAEKFFLGDSAAGRSELAALEREMGQLRSWSLIGSVLTGGEVRTYARLDFAGGNVVQWIALSETGDLAGADNGSGYPRLSVRPVAPTVFLPDPISGPVPAVEVSFVGGSLVVHDRDGKLRAQASR